MRTDQFPMLYVSPAGLQPNPWNTNRITDPKHREQLRESLKELGNFKPIVVRELGDGSLQILGGQHRWEEATAMGLEAVPIVNVGPIDDIRAKKIGLVDNARYGEDDPLGLRSLLAELGNNVLAILPISEFDLKGMEQAASINLDDLDTLDRSELPALDKTPPVPTSQLLRFKVPIEDVVFVQEQVEREMKAGGFKDEDSLTNAGHALVALLKKGAKARNEA